MTKKTNQIESKLIVKKTNETEQYLNAKTRMLPKTSHKNVCSKNLFKI